MREANFFQLFEIENFTPGAKFMCGGALRDSDLEKPISFLQSLTSIIS